MIIDHAGHAKQRQKKYIGKEKVEKKGMNVHLKMGGKEKKKTYTALRLWL